MNEEDDDQIITEETEDTITFTKSEMKAFYKEFEHSYISYYNPVAYEVSRRISRFVIDE